MSRFFRQAGDSSDSESESSDEESLLSGDNEEEEEEAPVQDKSKPIGMERFRWSAESSSGSSSSSSSSSDEDDDEESGEEKEKKKKRDPWGPPASDESSDEEKVVLKSAKDKRMEEVETCTKSIDNAVKINDWMAINNEFDKLCRLVQRQANISEPIPVLFIRTLANLEKSQNAAVVKEKDAKKKMNATNFKALNGMKSKIKKAIKDNEGEMKEYLDDPEAFEAKAAAALQAAREAQTVPINIKKRAQKVGSGDEGEDALGGEGSGDGFTSVGRGGKTYNFTSDSVFKHLTAIQEIRGKKNTDRVETMRILEKLFEVAATPYSRIRVLLSLVSARFDYNASVATHMPPDLWLSASREVDQLIVILISEPKYIVQEVVALDYDDSVERVPETEPDGVVLIRGSVISFVDRLDDEFTKSLQNIDPHGTEYVDRLKDSMGLYQIICRAQVYFELRDQSPALARVIMRRVEQVYSKPDAVVAALENSAAPLLAAMKSGPAIPTLASTGTTKQLIHTLCILLYQSSNSLLRTRAILCHIYHHALHNDFHTARDMLLMSHLGDSIANADVHTQILYNRAVVQLGLCAFRAGMIREARETLQDIFTTQRVKELLAQGIHQPKYGTALTPEQERAERQRQLPFHMHINTELLEAAFLVSSMLVEIPLLASIDNEELKRKAVSKPFRRLLDFADRQVFNGPPESTRDHIMQASRALREGNWEKTKELVLGIKIWSLMPEEKEVKVMLGLRIQEEGLRTYLFTNSAYYTTLSLNLLATTFSLPVQAVTSIISKMIWNEELSASLDYLPDTTSTKVPMVVFHRVELTRMQQLTQTLADKVNLMVEANEKALDQKLGASAPGGTGWDRETGPSARGDRKPVGGGAEDARSRGERTSRGRGRGGGRGARFAQGLGSRMDGARAQR